MIKNQDKIAEDFRVLMEFMPGAAAIVEKNGKIIYVNARFQSFFKYKNSGYLIGRKFQDFIKDAEEIRKVQSLMKLNRLHDQEAHIRIKGRETVTCLVNSSRADFFKPGKLLITLTDISRYFEEYRKIKDTSKKYRDIVKKGNEGIVIIQDGKVCFANPYMTKITGYKLANVVGKDFARFISKEYRQDVADILRRRLSGKSVPAKYEIRIITKKGRTKDIEVSGTLIDYNGRPADMAIIRDITHLKKTMKKLKKTSLEMLEALSSLVEDNDPYTAGHSSRVAELSVMVARELKLEDKQVETLKTAAYLHDLGKVGIPGSILNKPTRLSTAERIMINTHPLIGSRSIENISSFKEISRIILHHHERWDGTGYPSQLKGEMTPLLSRIIAVADSFEAMTSERPYRPNFYSDDKAFAILREGSGSQWDPRIVSSFIKAHKKYSPKHSN
jgi:PAS domain S-box-containing protein/putative nucleotidyltransferase with HDIG domain